jgi:hypothetical protein
MSDPQKAPGTFGELTTALTGASTHGDHGAAVGPPADAVVKIGHEADTFGVKSILMVPLAVALMAAVTYTVVTVIFKPTNRSAENPIVEAGPKAKEADERRTKISSTDPNPDVVHQPRLEGVRITESTRNGKSDPEFFRSVRFGDAGNSPEYYPEDLRADNFIDPATKQKVLRDYAWVVPNKVARIPVEAAMHLLVSEKMLPVKANGVRPPAGTATTPKLSNGGRGLAEEKKEPAKADEKKKDEHK